MRDCESIIVWNQWLAVLEPGERGRRVASGLTVENEGVSLTGQHGGRQRHCWGNWRAIERGGGGAWEDKYVRSHYIMVCIVSIGVWQNGGVIRLLLGVGYMTTHNKVCRSKCADGYGIRLH